MPPTKILLVDLTAQYLPIKMERDAMASVVAETAFVGTNGNRSPGPLRRSSRPS